MRRPTTILGLTLELLRARGLTRHAVVGALALSTAGLGVVAWLTHPHRATDGAARAQAALAWQRAPAASGAVFHDLSLTATASGWLLAWTRWDRSAVVQIASLGRDGTLLGEPLTLSSPDAHARFPRVARGPAGNAVVWTATERDRWSPRPYFALVDDSARIIVAPRSIPGAHGASYDVDAAYGADGWGVGWTFVDGPPSYVFARLSPRGDALGEPTYVDSPNPGFESALTWNGSSWIAAGTQYLSDRDEGAVRLRSFNREGRLFHEATFGQARGGASSVHCISRGASTFLTWGSDCVFGMRHDPRFARIDDRSVAVGPTALGPRRSGRVPSIACVADGCTLAWAGLSEDPSAHADFYTQRITHEGSSEGPPRVIPSPALASGYSHSAIATSIDERETLAVWSAFGSEHGGVYVVRLNAEGAPVAPGHELPLR